MSTFRTFSQKNLANFLSSRKGFFVLTQNTNAETSDFLGSENLEKKKEVLYITPF